LIAEESADAAAGRLQVAADDEAADGVDATLVSTS